MHPSRGQRLDCPVVRALLPLGAAPADWAELSAGPFAAPPSKGPDARSKGMPHTTRLLV